MCDFHEEDRIFFYNRVEVCFVCEEAVIKFFYDEEIIMFMLGMTHNYRAQSHVLHEEF